jgi:hypothetical protein
MRPLADHHFEPGMFRRYEQVMRDGGEVGLSRAGRS